MATGMGGDVVKVGEYKYVHGGVVLCHQYHIVCPGCHEVHAIGGGQHEFNGSFDRPTFKPSLLLTTRRFTERGDLEYKEWCEAGYPKLNGREFDSAPVVCHSFVTDGRIAFLADCTHGLKGQTVDLPEFVPDGLREVDRYINLPMKPLENLLIPALNRADLTRRCLESIDYPIKNLVLVNNGCDPEIEKLFCDVKCGRMKVPAERVFYQHRHQYGIGCGPTMNFFVKNFPEAPYWFWTSNDMKFEPGALKMFAEFMAGDLPKDLAMVYCGFWGYACAAVRRVGVQTIGFMDENIYPAYCEDCDYGYRLFVAGLKAHRVECQVIHGDDGKTSSATIGDPEVKRKNEITHPNNMRYYVEKWGGGIGKETFKTPFNSGYPLDYWKMDLDYRVGNTWERL